MVQADLVESAKELQRSPEKFFKTILGASAEDYQNKILRAIVENDRVAISAAHDLGKSWLMARVVLWFGSCFPGSKIITTAPTHLQVKSILWSELRTAHKNSRTPLGGILNQTEWKIDDDWFAMGFTPRNEVTHGAGQGTQSSFQGWHAPYILIVFDEATGIPPNIWNMAEGLLTSARVKFACIGNPTSRNSEFFKCFKSPEWAKVYLSCFDSPNLIANGIIDMRTMEHELDLLRSMNESEALARLKNYEVVKPWLLSTSWVMGRALKWGISHPLFVSKVLGKFPEEGDNTLIPLGVVENAQLRTPIVKPSDRKVIGVDVARFGTDLTVMTRIHGPQFISKKALVKRDTMQVAGEVLAECNQNGWPDVIVVDATGIGSGVVDSLKQSQNERVIPPDVYIREVQFGAAPRCDLKDCGHSKDCDKAKYTNIKGRMFDLLAQDLRANLSLPMSEDVYLDELPTILYAYDSKGRMVIESKDDYKKRTGRQSPDHADSLALANYGRYDETSVGFFGESSDAPATRASKFRGDAW